jgi:hypothetical protein
MEDGGWRLEDVGACSPLCIQPPAYIYICTLQEEQKTEMLSVLNILNNLNNEVPRW